MSARTVGNLVSPSLYQLNITIPANTPSGDNLLNRLNATFASLPGVLIAGHSAQA